MPIINRTSGPSAFFLLLCLSLLAPACELEDPREGISSDQIISLKSSGAEAPANGIATIELTAELLDKADPNKEITFRTAYGSFSNADPETPKLISITASGRKAVALLQMENKPSKDFLVSAEVEGFKDEIKLTAVPALPESMLFSTGRQVIQPNAGNEAELTVKLFRNEGVVSDGTKVEFSQAPLDNSLAELTLPDFDFTTDNELATSVRSNNLEEGPVLVIARTLAAGGQMLADSLVITVRE